VPTDKQTMDKEKLEKYLSEKYTQEEGQTCKVIIKYFQYLGKTDDGDDKISFEGVIRRRGA
jgi:hypothetical protein